MKAVAECHSKNIAHCDISPFQFVYLTPRRKNHVRILKLIDFGCGSEAGLRTTFPRANQCARTPEEVRYPRPKTREPINLAHGDIWALGVLLYFMIKGEFPFDSTQGDQVHYDAQKQVFEPTWEWPDDIKSIPGVALILTAIFKENPSERPTAEELVIMIDRFICPA